MKKPHSLASTMAPLVGWLVLGVLPTSVRSQSPDVARIESDGVAVADARTGPVPVVEHADADETDGLVGDPEGILDLDIEQLARVDVVVPAMDMEVSTVSRTESTVGRSPAAVFVVTNEMIRRSGARSVPDALRLVPGVNVARVSAGRWAITIRGFNNVYANKLLVQIDGRSVYNPVFSGVYWDRQDLLLEDVERSSTALRLRGGLPIQLHAIRSVARRRVCRSPFARP